MLNKVHLIGHLGHDPSVRTTPGGQDVASFSLATNRKWKNSDGERQEETEWHQIVCWGRQCEIAAQYLAKGSLVYVEGRIQTRSWLTEGGEKKYKTEIVCDRFQMLGGREPSAAVKPAEADANELPF